MGVTDPWIKTLRAFRGQESTPVIPILMYHSITSDPEPGVSSYFRLNTPPALFRSHLQVLRDEGYTVLTLVGAIDWMEGDRSEGPAPGAPGTDSAKIAVITFDDGFEDFYTSAFPLLQEFDFPATVFLPTAFIGTKRRSFKERACLTWDEIRELCELGVEFGSHTVNHLKLWELDEASLYQELVDSRKTIEQELGLAPATFAHPYAFPFTNKPYVRRFQKAVSQAGYRCGVTTSLGRVRSADDRLTLKRLPVNGADGPDLLGAKLRGAYDWLAGPQRLVKILKRVSRR